MQTRTVDEPARTDVATEYSVVLAEVRRLVAELQLAVGAAGQCGPQRETAVMVDLHNRARGIAARLNQALAVALPIKDSR
jgi:hypothetical protein